MVFFIVAASLFPLGVGPEPQVLRQIAPGVVWVCALLAAMLSLNTLFASDHQDGSLEQMLLSQHSTIMVAAGKALAHWLLTGLPLILAAPVLGVLFDMRASSILTMEAGLVLGTPVLSLLGSIGAALTLGLRSGGVLILLLVLPLCIPVLIFGAGAVGSVDVGLSAISVSAWPCRLRVSAPSGKSRQRLSLRARNLSISTRPGSSSTGSVSGGHTRLVTPPAAAAALRISMS